MGYQNDTGYHSITDALSPYIDKRWFTDYHRNRGSYAHAGMSAYALNLFFAANKDGWNGYIISGKRWFDQYVKKVLYVEQRLTCHDYRTTGQSDLIAIMRPPWDDLTALIDWKTSQAEYKTWKYQTGGYKYLTEKNLDVKIDIRLAVRLRQEATKDCLHSIYKDHDHDESIMLQLVNCYNALGG